MSTPQISVIVVNWNGERVIGPCLQSLARQTLRPHQVIVVDNGSLDNSLQVVHAFEDLLPLTVVPVGENLGFARANNIGIALATGEAIALLNNDAEAEPQWLEELVATMGRHEGCGIVASRLLVHGAGVIDSAGDGFSTALKGFKMGEGEPARSREAEEEVMAACAGAALYSRKCLDDAGLFDEEFFLIWEDMDLSLRARWRGWRVFYSPKAVVHHKVRSSIGAESQMSVYYTVRNCGFVRVKNIPATVFLRCLLPCLLGEIAMFAYFCLKRRRWGAYLRGKADGLVKLPVMLEKRRGVMEGRELTTDEFYRLFTPVLRGGVLAQKMRKFLENRDERG